MSLSLSLVELRHIGQMYGAGAHRFVALQDVNLHLHEGEFVALLGPSGCGKSTLLRIITGLQQPTAGQVRYRGQPVQGVNPHTTIVFQTFALFPWLTVQDNVEVALKAHGVAPAQRAHRAVDLLAEVKVDLPHPRQRKAIPFLQVMDHVYAMLAGQTQPEHVEMGTAPGEAGKTRALPPIAISDLAGLLEHVNEAPRHRADIYKLATELKVDLDALLRLTETAELLG